MGNHLKNNRKKISKKYLSYIYVYKRESLYIYIYDTYHPDSCRVQRIRVIQPESRSNIKSTKESCPTF